VTGELAKVSAHQKGRIMNDLKRNLVLLSIIVAACSIPSLSHEITYALVQHEVTDNFNKQVDCLARNIYYEAGSEPYEGKLAVAGVVMNRVNDPRFPHTICGVVFQKENGIAQFSWTDKRVSDNKDKYQWEESMIVAKKSLTDKHLHDIITKSNAEFYHAEYVNPNWNKKKIIKIGKHIFYAQNNGNKPINPIIKN